MAALLVVFAAPACRNQADTPPPVQQAAPVDSAAVTPAPGGLPGVWTVVAYHLSDISTMTASQAEGWIGRTLRLSAAGVVSGEVRCDRPSYTTITMDADKFLQGDFHLAPGAIMRLATREQLNLIDVLCEGRPIQAMGRLIIEIDADHILAPWEGVFFELARDHDFRALGQEPFWSLQIIKGRELRLERPGREDLVLPAPAVRRDPATGRETCHVATDGGDMLVVIEPGRCTDAMSGYEFEARVTVTLEGEVLQGCGGPLAE